MRIFKNAWFERFAHKQGISDQVLIEAVTLAEQGWIDANLGSGVIKLRIARKGQSKSRGFRTIIFYKTNERAFFVYGFAKSDKENITTNEETAFKKSAPLILSLTDKQISELIKIGQFTEVLNDEELSK